jgi:lipid-binding SYLF domain-containing protein
LVLRRTIQRHAHTGTSNRLLRAWPQFRLDDEIDVAVHLLDTLVKTDFDSNNLEAATIRKMMQTAYGLCFVQSHKWVLGVSVHAGAGIVVARLPDGTWSAPSAIGVAGVGLGLQLGVEVLGCLFVLQTKDALDQLTSQTNTTILGANLGLAVAGVGREAMGAASVSNVVGGYCGTRLPTTLPMDDEYHYDDYDNDNDNDNDDNTTQPSSPSSPNAQSSSQNNTSTVTPIVAYATTMGVYMGVSLEGSRIFTRHDMNARTYQFANANGTSKKPVTPLELLSGKIPTPPEAEPLYAALHAVEYTHELSQLPRIPKSLSGSSSWKASQPATSIPKEDNEDFGQSMRHLLGGGVSVVRLGGRRRQRREPRTLWLYQPSDGPLAVGFVSKSSPSKQQHQQQQLQQQLQLQPPPPPPQPQHHYKHSMNDQSTVTSEEVTLDSALLVRICICICY